MYITGFLMGLAFGAIYPNSKKAKPIFLLGTSAAITSALLSNILFDTFYSSSRGSYDSFIRDSFFFFIADIIPALIGCWVISRFGTTPRFSIARRILFTLIVLGAYSYTADKILPTFSGMLTATRAELCQNNLILIEHSKKRWQVDNAATNGQIISSKPEEIWLKLAPYTMDAKHIDETSYFRCPDLSSKKHYIYNPLGTSPQCHLESEKLKHSLKWKRQWWIRYETQLAALAFASSLLLLVFIPSKKKTPTSKPIDKKAEE